MVLVGTYVRYLLGLILLRSVWGHLVHIAKFLMLRFLKGYCSNNFHPISTKLYRKYVIGLNTGYYFLLLLLLLLLFITIGQILKVYGTLKRSYLSYISIIHKAMLVLSGKRSSRWALFCLFFVVFCVCFFVVVFFFFRFH